MFGRYNIKYLDMHRKTMSAKHYSYGGKSMPMSTQKRKETFLLEIKMCPDKQWKFIFQSLPPRGIGLNLIKCPHLQRNVIFIVSYLHGGGDGVCLESSSKNYFASICVKCPDLYRNIMFANQYCSGLVSW